MTRPCAALLLVGLVSACVVHDERRPPERGRTSPPQAAPAPRVLPTAPPETVVILRDPAPPPTSADVESKQVAELIAQATRIAAAGTEEQRRELAAANQEFARDNGPRARLRLALLLALPGTPVHDDGRALALLEPLASSSAAATPLRQFAWLLHGQVSERLREQKKAVQLKEQIDGLRAIERSLMERERGKK